MTDRGTAAKRHLRRAAFFVSAIGALVSGARPAAEPAPTLKAVLLRAAAYVADFQRQLSGIVAEEQYEQVVSYPGSRPQVDRMTRHLRSDLLLVKPPGAQGWLEFRDVFEVDGEPVRDRNERLVKLFLNPPASVDAQIRSIISDSARYNIGSALRNVNVPVLPLKFLEARNQPRFKFKRVENGAPSEITNEAPAPPGHFRISTEVWVVQYSEQDSPTIVRTPAMKDIRARGRLWIEPSSGRVLMTEVVFEDRHIRAVIDVNYQSEPLVGLLVPIEMRERYERLGDKSVIDGFATYGRFREFQVNVSESFLIKE